MCGIFLYFGDESKTIVTNEFFKTQARGPDNSHIIVENKLFIGFHRLMINDLSYTGDQPFLYDNCILICNGEIYNFEALKEKFELVCTSGSDCEVIVHLYNKLKTKYQDLDEVVYHLCNLLDGEYAFIIYDKFNDKIITARDRYGIRPLFLGLNSDNSFGFASEMKSLNNLFETIEQFKPSTYAIFNKNNSKKIYKYNNISEPYDLNNNNVDLLLPQIKQALELAVCNRLTSDVPLCALLSGGVDSSLVCGILSKYMDKPLHTFSIGLLSSPDLKYAQKVADHIKSIHHEHVVTEQEMLDAIPEVIRITETYDITTIRASTPHYLISKYIRENTDFKCLFSGEGSDELNGSYAYFKKAPDMDAFHDETNRLLEDICYFDNLRADRCISSQGLEARVPFLDHHFVKLIQSIDPKLKMCDDKIEKYLLRKAFDGIDLIPAKVLWRPKEAFSDGVSQTTKSWYQIIQEHVDTLITDDEFKTEAPKYTHCTPHTKEAYYYRKIFHSHYKHNNILPYIWLPKFVDSSITDPSARTLKNIYVE